MKLDGTQQCFDIELWRWAPREVVVGKWTAPDPNAYGVPPASTSWGVWPMVAGQRWGAYRIHAPDGTLLKYRFDALENPRAIDGEPRQVAFDDLLLDVTVEVDSSSSSSYGAVTVEDEDEVEAAAASGALRPEQLKEVLAFRSAIVANPDAFLAEVDAHIAAAEEYDACNRRGSGTADTDSDSGDRSAGGAGSRSTRGSVSGPKTRRLMCDQTVDGYMAPATFGVKVSASSTSSSSTSVGSVSSTSVSSAYLPPETRCEHCFITFALPKELATHRLLHCFPDAPEEVLARWPVGSRVVDIGTKAPRLTGEVISAALVANLAHSNVAVRIDRGAGARGGKVFNIPISRLSLEEPIISTTSSTKSDRSSAHAEEQQQRAALGRLHNVRVAAAVGGAATAHAAGLWWLIGGLEFNGSGIDAVQVTAAGLAIATTLRHTAFRKNSTLAKFDLSNTAFRNNCNNGTYESATQRSRGAEVGGSSLMGAGLVVAGTLFAIPSAFLGAALCAAGTGIGTSIVLSAPTTLAQGDVGTMVAGAAGAGIFALVAFAPVFPICSSLALVDRGALMLAHHLDER